MHAPARALALTAAATLLAAAAAPAQGKDQELRLTLSIDRESLVAEDTTRAHLWIVNPGASRATGAWLFRTGPRFVKLGEQTREGGCGPAADSLAVGAVAPGGAAIRHVCVWTGPEVEEGDVNLGFSLRYHWADTAGRAGTTYVLAERKVKVGLFGTETVANVPVRLAALVVPGLLFFLVLRLLRVPFAEKLSTGESGTLAVILSVLLFALAAQQFPAGTRHGISLWRFLDLCAVGAGLAALVWAGHALHRRYRRRFLVAARDDTREALRKLVEARESGVRARLRAWLGRARGPEEVTVTLTDGTRLTGSAAGETEDGGLALLGWFRVDVGLKDPDLAAMQRKETDGCYADLLEQAREKGAKFGPHHSIEAAAPTAPDGELRWIPRDKIARVVRGPARHGRRPVGVYKV